MLCQRIASLLRKLSVVWRASPMSTSGKREQRWVCGRNRGLLQFQIPWCKKEENILRDTIPFSASNRFPIRPSSCFRQRHSMCSCTPRSWPHTCIWIAWQITRAETRDCLSSSEPARCACMNEPTSISEDSRGRGEGLIMKP